jgi:hypothetical protein
MRLGSIALMSAIVAAGLADPGLAQERELRAISAFAEQTDYTKGFLSFIERVNESGKSRLWIRFVGGPRRCRRSRSALRSRMASWISRM